MSISNYQTPVDKPCHIRKTKKGFTLIELLVVMSILAILVLIASSDLIGQKERARVMEIRKDVMLAEGKVGEHLFLNIMKFQPWKTVDYEELEKLKEDGVLYAFDGAADYVYPTYYKQLTDDYIDNEVSSDLDGMFFMNDDGGVYYADVGEGYDVPAYVPPRVVTPNMEIISGGGWVYEDFLYTGDSLSGLSAIGIERYNNGQNNLILPDVNPYTGERIVFIEPDSFRKYTFDGEFTGETIEHVGDDAFRKSDFSGDFYMPNIERIDSDSFRMSNFRGSFVAPKLRIIEQFAFRDSEFMGEFYAPSIEYVATDAFRISKFTGEFLSPKLISVGTDAFRESTFTGEFYAPHLKHRGTNAFLYSQFSSGF